MAVVGITSAPREMEASTAWCGARAGRAPSATSTPGALTPYTPQTQEIVNAEVLGR